MRRVLAGAAIAIAAVVTVVGVRERRRVEVGANEFVNPPGIIDAFSSPSIVASPRAPASVVVVFRKDRPMLSARIGWSADGGRTWRSTALPLPAGDDRPFFPDAAFAPDGTLYVSYVNLAGRGNVPAHLWVARSTDDGRTLSAPGLVATGLTFQPRIAVGADGVVHATWLDVVRHNPAARGLVDVSERIVTSRSADEARSWSPPAPVSPPGGDLVGAATPVATGSGLVVAYEDFGRRPHTLVNGGTAAPGRPFDVLVTAAATGAASFTKPAMVAHGVVSSQRFSYFFSQFTSLAAGPAASLYITWAASHGPTQDVFVSRSPDGGGIWGSPVQVDTHRGGAGVSASFPQVPVGPAGRVDVVYLYRPGSAPDTFTDAYLAMSGDQGRTFRTVRLSSESFNTSVAPDLGGGAPGDPGSHLGLAEGSGTVHAAWADTRLGTESTGREDVVTAAARVPGPVPAARRWLLATAGALAVVAAVLLGRDRSARLRPRAGRPGAAAPGHDTVDA